MIAYKVAKKLPYDMLERWLLWVIKDDPGKERIMKECLGKDKERLLAGLSWTGAIS